MVIVGAGAVDEPPGFRRFVEGHSRSLLRAAWLLTGDWYAAEDLVQSALVVAWTHWSTLTRPDAPEAYVRQVMVRTFLRWRRRRWTGELSTETVDAVDRPDAFADVDLRRSLASVLADLPPQQRATVVLRHFLDLSEAAAAEVLGCSVGAVKQHNSRALDALRRSPDLEALRNDRGAV
ncbi:MAG: SigE family RNA polymerase sigma factor [Jatrophihabitans sp.]|uniref:SigE family RNA polymerase sigma factor n=1 Tax=Jatrophihabitans sp. TaxID=1932789 RepID=UPI003F817E9D